MDTGVAKRIVPGEATEAEAVAGTEAGAMAETTAMGDGDTGVARIMETPRRRQAMVRQ